MNELENKYLYIINNVLQGYDRDIVINHVAELEQQKAELIEALRLSNNCINHAREYLKNKTDFRDNGLYKLRVISNEDLIKNIT